VCVSALRTTTQKTFFLFPCLFIWLLCFLLRFVWAVLWKEQRKRILHLVWTFFFLCEDQREPATTRGLCMYHGSRTKTKTEQKDRSLCLSARVCRKAEQKKAFLRRSVFGVVAQILRKKRFACVWSLFCLWWFFLVVSSSPFPCFSRRS